MEGQQQPLEIVGRAPSLGDRIKGARYLAGYGSQTALAAAINKRGLGATTIKAFETNSAVPEDWQLRAIAEACGVSDGFWVMDPKVLGATPEENRSRELGLIAAELDRLDGAISAILDAQDELRDDLLRSGVIKPRSGEDATQALARSATEETLAAALAARRRLRQPPAQPGAGRRDRRG